MCDEALTRNWPAVFTPSLTQSGRVRVLIHTKSNIKTWYFIFNFESNNFWAWLTVWMNNKNVSAMAPWLCGENEICLVKNLILTYCLKQTNMKHGYFLNGILLCAPNTVSWWWMSFYTGCNWKMYFHPHEWHLCGVLEVLDLCRPWDIPCTWIVSLLNEMI